MSKWYCTDDDCLQYCRKNADGTFSFIEKLYYDTCNGDEGYPDKSYLVKTATIDLKNYTQGMMEIYISSYYSSLDQIRETYGNASNQIIAECIFEGDFGEFGSDCWLSGMMTENEADDFIKKYISERQMIL